MGLKQREVKFKLQVQDKRYVYDKYMYKSDKY